MKTLPILLLIFLFASCATTPENSYYMSRNLEISKISDEIKSNHNIETTISFDDYLIWDNYFIPQRTVSFLVTVKNHSNEDTILNPGDFLIKGDVVEPSERTKDKVRSSKSLDTNQILGIVDQQMINSGPSGIEIVADVLGIIGDSIAIARDPNDPELDYRFEERERRYHRETVERDIEVRNLRNIKMRLQGFQSKHVIKAGETKVTRVLFPVLKGVRNKVIAIRHKNALTQFSATQI